MSHESGDLNILVVFHFFRCSKTLGEKILREKMTLQSDDQHVSRKKKINVQAHNAEPYIERI